MRALTSSVTWTPLCLALLSVGCSAEEGTNDTRGTAGAGGASTAVAGAAGASGGPAAGDQATSATAGSSGAGAPGGTAGSAGLQSGDDPGGTGEDQPCTTIGATRVCCGVGEQTCVGTDELPVWGPCMESDGVPIVECNPCASDEFGPGCDAGMPPPESSPDAGTPPDAGQADSGSPPECGPGMECKPGSERYCDDPAGEWTKSTCDAAGHWGACLQVPVPPAAVGHGDCSDFDYSPEMCCGPAMLCCQDDPGGPWVDFGSGACAAVSCP